MSSLSRAALAVLVIFGLGKVVLPDPANAGSREDAIFRGLLERVKRGDRHVDFTVLRNAWTRTSFYKPYVNAGADRRIWQLFNKGRNRQVIREAAPLLAKNYLEATIHMILTVAYKEVGDRRRHLFHRFVARGLARSMMASGNGATPATAYKAVSFNEEYAILWLRRAVKEQKALINWRGRAIDRFHVRYSTKSGPKRGIIYIDVTPLLARGRF